MTFDAATGSATPEDNGADMMRDHEITASMATLAADVKHLSEDIRDMRTQIDSGQETVMAIRERMSETGGLRRWMLVIAGAVVPLALVGLINAVKMQSSIDEMRRTMIEHTNGGGHRETQVSIEAIRKQLNEWVRTQVVREKNQDEAIDGLKMRIDTVERKRRRRR